MWQQDQMNIWKCNLKRTNYTSKLRIIQKHRNTQNLLEKFMQDGYDLPTYFTARRHLLNDARTWTRPTVYVYYDMHVALWYVIISHNIHAYKRISKRNVMRTSNKLFHKYAWHKIHTAAHLAQLRLYVQILAQRIANGLETPKQQYR